jgi:hypothetical protein
MKILAYGGNQYSIRAKIGEWPETLTASLGDFYGIPPGQASFGVVFPGTTPCLLYRERMNVEMRSGGYPYTILLELGPASREDRYWSAAQYNAAALLYFLFRAESRWRALLLAPENLSSAVLEGMLNELLAERFLDEFREPGADARTPGSWASLVAGSVIEEDPTVATPSSLGLTARPSMREVAGWTARMPSVTRIGRGWMVGGSLTQAAAFGAVLLVDDQPYGADADPGTTMEAGSRVLNLLDGAIRSGEITPELSDGREGVSELFRRLLLLDRVRQGGEEAYREPLPLTGRLNVALFDAALHRAELMAGRGQRMGPMQSRAVLEAAQARDAYLDEGVFRHLDAGMLRGWLEARNIPPEPIPPGFDIPAEILSARCLDKIEAEGWTPGAVERYRRYLHENRAERAEDTLLDQVAPHVSSPLTAWAARGDDPKLRKLLNTEAERRFRTRQGKSWLADAVRLLGAKWVMEQLESSREDLDLPVRNLLDERPLSVEARDLLQSLAESAVRPRLSTILKTAIAEKVHEGWESLWLLAESLQGRGEFPATRFRGDREVLAPECMDLIESYANAGRLRISKVSFGAIVKSLRLDDGYEKRLRVLAKGNVAFARIYSPGGTVTEGEARLQISGGDTRRSERDAPKPGRRARINERPARATQGVSARLRATSGSAEPGESEAPVDEDVAGEMDKEESAQGWRGLNALKEAAAIQRSMAELIEALEQRRVRFEGTSAKDRDAEWDALVDILRFRKLAAVRGKTRASHDYGPEGSYVPLAVTVFFMTAAVLIMGLAAAGEFRNPISGVSMRVLIVGLFLAGAIFFSVSRALAQRYTVNLPGEQYDRLDNLMDQLLERGKNSYALSREKYLLERIAADRPLGGLGSFDRALLLYLGSHPKRVDEFASERPEAIRRIRKGIYETLVAEHMIRHKGWLA